MATTPNTTTTILGKTYPGRPIGGPLNRPDRPRRPAPSSMLTTASGWRSASAPTISPPTSRPSQWKAVSPFRRSRLSLSPPAH
jgi:hypothetical protein